MKRWILMLMCSATLAGCADDSTTNSNAVSYTKDEAALLGGKTDIGRDVCALMSWYGDGECDTFCPNPDPDCSTACSSDADCATGQACLDGSCGDVTPQECGGLLGLQCAVGEYCHYEITQNCGNADQMGTCETKPDVCPEIYAPVCGCDGRTYSSACDAAGNGVNVASTGECETTESCSTDADCAADEVCMNGACEISSVSTACGGIAGVTCAANEYCHYELGDMCGAADQMGTCQPRPQACTQVYDPVCGCDGNTYSNACTANSSGTSVYSNGPCQTQCASDADCATDEACVNGVCTAPSNERACGGRLGATCAPDEFCDYTRQDMCGYADAQGVCRARPQACIQVYDPVCGCDGKTYSNACMANSSGTSVYSDGPCQTQCSSDADCGLTEVCKNGLCEAASIGQNCGGLQGLTCERDEYCYYGPQEMCGAADQFGTCKARPQACPAVVMPVCGCDGNTYSNACEAAMAGVSATICTR